MDTYAYDGANRLQSASESGTGTWSQTYGFDTRGNRWVSAYSGLPTPTAEVPQASGWYGTNNNQISAWSYDNAGNVTAIANMQRSFAHDAESRQASATINGQTTTYSYDGDGRRVRKSVTDGTIWHFHDRSRCP